MEPRFFSDEDLARLEDLGLEVDALPRPRLRAARQMQIGPALSIEHQDSTRSGWRVLRGDGTVLDLGRTAPLAMDDSLLLTSADEVEGTRLTLHRWR